MVMGARRTPDENGIMRCSVQHADTIVHDARAKQEIVPLGCGCGKVPGAK